MQEQNLVNAVLVEWCKRNAERKIVKTSDDSKHTVESENMLRKRTGRACCFIFRIVSQF